MVVARLPEIPVAEEPMPNEPAAEEFDHEIANIYSEEATELLEAAENFALGLEIATGKDKDRGRGNCSVSCTRSKAGARDGRYRCHGRSEPRTRNARHQHRQRLGFRPTITHTSVMQASLDELAAQCAIW